MQMTDWKGKGDKRDKLWEMQLWNYDLQKDDNISYHDTSQFI